MLAATILIVGQGWVRGMVNRRPQYPCAFEVRHGERWRGGYSLDDVRKLEGVAAKKGDRAAVRLRHVNRKHAAPMIRCVAKAYGMATGPFLSVADCESHVTPDDNIYQYIPSTWASSSVAYGHAGADESDAYANIHTTVQKVKAEGWGPWTCQPG
jgi:hypothetical protein